MKRFIISLYMCLISLTLLSQTGKDASEINKVITSSTGLAPLRFLAADELMGRSNMRPEINMAARYISEQFKSLVLKEVPGTTEYFQIFELHMIKPATAGSFVVKEKKFEIGKDLLQFEGKDISLDAPVIFTGHAAEEDLTNIDIKGKIVVADIGDNDSTKFIDGFSHINEKQRSIQKKGAMALIVRFKEGDFPWEGLLRYLAKERAVENGQADFPVLIVNDKNKDLVALKGNAMAPGTLTTSGNTSRDLPAKNVMAWVEGTGTKLKDQFIVLTAHYDHLGVTNQPQMEEGKLDSIYNGARDNAIGTAAVMDAARYFAQHPPKRSVLFIAYTAEEMGEIGSKYFSAHPPIPLNKIVYNLNIDNASYNDTNIVSVVGLGRTSADNNIKKACAAYGLKAMPDPAPEQNLFDRSDNVNLAIKGIPAPTFSLGMNKFDGEIMKRYHQLSDEVGNLDLNYGVKFIRSFILAAKYIADDPEQPVWRKGDKYEAAWEKLFQ